MSRKGFKPTPNPERQNRKETIQEEKKVGIVFELDRTDKPKIIEVFTFDLSRLEMVAEDVQKELLSVDVKEYRKEYGLMLDDVLLKPPTPEIQERFRSIIIDYLCTFNSPSDWIKQHPGMSVGFIFNVVNYEEDPKIMAVDMTSWKLMVERTTKKK
jgi:hypothetical protein